MLLKGNHRNCLALLSYLAFFAAVLVQLCTMMYNRMFQNKPAFAVEWLVMSHHWKRGEDHPEAVNLQVQY